MADVIRMPAAVAGETEAVLTAWLVAEGEAFAAQDVVATVETAKASFDVEASAGGVLLKRLVGEGAEVEAGAPIAVTGTAGETAQDASELLSQLGLAVPDTPAAGAGAAAPADAAPVPAAPIPAVAQAPPETPQAPPAGGAAAPAAPNGTPAAGGSRSRPQRIFISPLARRMARDAGLPVEQLRGTGPNGRIVRRDVEQAISTQQAASPDVQPPAGPPPEVQHPAVQPAAVQHTTPQTVPPAAPGPVQPPAPGYRDQPHSRRRRVMARRLTESVRNAPHFYLRGTAEVSRLMRLRDQLNAAAPAKISLTDLVIKAAAHAHVRVPEMNVIWTPDAVRHFTAVDLSVAIATDGGLVTPVIRGADRLSVGAISAIVSDQAQRARSGRLRQEELEGGVATISNLGMHGTQDFAAIINPPQSAILAVGAVRDEPVVRHGKVRPGRLLTATLSVDHRSVDGVTAARWMEAFTSLLADPAQILL